MRLGTKGPGKRRDGSVLIIVLWVTLGLVSVALYFAQSMIFELRAADNRVAGLEAEQAIEGGARYVMYVLANQQQRGQMPDLPSYQREGVPVGEARFWIIGRGDRQSSLNDPYFSVVDEASKLNLNTTTNSILEGLPRMTTELAAAIQDWRDSDENVSASGAESETYARLQPPYKCKNAPFETVDELRLVVGAELDVLYGEDSNLNGILDANENDGNVSLPDDNRDGKLDPGILEYVTIYTREPLTNSLGSNRVDVTASVGPGSALQDLLQSRFDAKRATQIMQSLAAPTPVNSVLAFYVKSGMTEDEFAQISADVVGSSVDGLVNVNTASAEVLACIPGIGTDKASTLVAYRQTNPDKLTSVAWVADLLERTNILAAGRYLTGQSYQYSADIAAVGHHGRGYRRTRFVFDLSGGTPTIRYRQDLTHLGWAIGKRARESLQLAKNLR